MSAPLPLPALPRRREVHVLISCYGPMPGRASGPTLLRVSGGSSRSARAPGEAGSAGREPGAAGDARCGRVESNHQQPEATRLQRAELADAQRPHDEGRPAGFEPTPLGSRPRMLPLHHDHHARWESTERIPTARGAPEGARTTTELRGRDSNPRSRAHEAREDSRSSTARRHNDLVGWSRTSALRFPKPAGWPASLRPGAWACPPHAHELPGRTRTCAARGRSPPLCR